MSSSSLPRYPSFVSLQSAVDVPLPAPSAMVSLTPPRRLIIDPSRPPTVPSLSQETSCPSSETRQHRISVESAFPPSPPVRSPTPSPAARVRPTDTSPSSPPRRSNPGKFSPILRHVHISGINSSAAVPSVEVRRLRHIPNVLTSTSSDGGGKRRASMSSVISSPTPNETEMFQNGPLNDAIEEDHELPRSGQRATEGSGGERFSNVPTIFDVGSRSVGVSTHDSSSALLDRTSLVGTAVNPFFDPNNNEGSFNIHPVPRATEALLMLSRTVAAEIVPPSTSGPFGRLVNLDGPYDSDKMEQRVKHYEGCMLCSPLPSPRESISSTVPEGPLFAPSDQHAGPPPNVPLPLLKQQLMDDRIKASTTLPSINTLKSYHELEGEVAQYDESADNLLEDTIGGSQLSPPKSRQPGAERTFNPRDHIYHQLAHSDSLSTLLEGDEESHYSRHQSPYLIVAQVSGEASNRQSRRNSRECEFSRPQTTGKDSPFSRPNTGPANNSEQELISFPNQDVPFSRFRNPLKFESPFAKSTNPFKRRSDNGGQLSAIYERDLRSRRTSWRSLRRENPYGISELEPEIIELGDATDNTSNRQFSTSREVSGYKVDIRTEPQASTGIHPGIRRDRPGMDGSYEVVDLGSQIDNVLSTASYKARALAIRRTNARWGRAKWGIFGCVAVTIALIVILLVWDPSPYELPRLISRSIFVAFPRAAQKAVNRSKVEIASMSLSEATLDTVKLNMNGFLTTGTSINANLLPTNFSLVLKNISDMMKRGTPVSREDGILGYLSLLESVNLSKGPTASRITLEGGYNGLFNISNVDAWSGFLQVIVLGVEGTEVEIQGNIAVKAGALSTKYLLRKSFLLPALAGVKTKLTSYQFSPLGGFSMVSQVGWINQAPVILDFGTVRFALNCGNTTVGIASVENFSVHSGSNYVTINGTLDTKLLLQEKALLGNLLSSLGIRKRNTTSILARDNPDILLQGEAAFTNSQEIPWMAPLIRAVSIALPEVTFSGPEKVVHANAGFNLTLSLILQQDSVVVQYSSLKTVLDLGFVGGVFGSNLTELGVDFKLSTPWGQEFARLSYSPSPATSDGEDVLSIVKNATFSVIEYDVWVNSFVREFLRTQRVSLIISGTVSIGLQTTLGDALVEDVEYPETYWNVPALNGFKDFGLRITNLSILSGTPAGLMVSALAKLSSSSSLAIDLGKVDFVLSYRDKPIGTLSFISFAIHPGANTFPVTLNISAVLPPQASTFLTDFSRGGVLRVLISASPEASTLSSGINGALQGLSTTADLVTSGYLTTISDVEMSVYNDMSGLKRLRAAIDVYNPFGAAVTVTAISVNMTLPDQRNASIITIGHVVLRNGEKNRLMARLVNGFDAQDAERYLQRAGVVEANLQGDIALDFGGWETIVHTVSQRKLFLVSGRGP